MMSKANHVSKKQENKGVRSMQSILKPGKNEIGSCITKSEKEYGYCDKLLYSPCVKDVRDNWKLESINEDFVNGYVKTFLINWGMMGRVLNNKHYEGWCKELAPILRKHFNALKTFQNMSLENGGNEGIEGLKDDVINIYQEIRDVVGPTSASKVLHLICPDFFPLWDDNIRKKARAEMAKRAGLNCEGKGYYVFMIEIKKFLKTYADAMNDLEKEYRKSKLRLADEFMWWVANEKK